MVDHGDQRTGAHHRHPHRRGGDAEAAGGAAAAGLGPDHPGDREHAEHQGRVVDAGAGAPLGQVAGAEVLDLLRHRDGVRLADPLVGAAEEHHAGERRDEPGDPDVGHPHALPGADQRADGQPEQHAEPPRDAPVPDRQRHDDADHGGHRADGQVDVPGDDHQHHADREDQHVGVAVDDVLRVGRREHLPAGGEVEDQHQRDQREHHAELAGTAAEQLLE
jgi:hypothetical protein